MAKFEANYSRFRPDSLLTRLNRAKRLEKPPAELLRMLTIACEYYELSEGYFNIATETHQRAQGYDAAYSFVDDPRLQPVTLGIDDALHFDEQGVLLDSRVTLDLGGLGKGFLIDKLAAEFWRKFNLRYFVINGGGDIYATSNQGRPIELHLVSSHDRQWHGKVSVTNRALCASSPKLRSWGRRTHIINPLTPDVIPTRSSFVLARSAVEADILATVATLVPAEKFAHLVQDRAVDFKII